MIHDLTIGDLDRETLRERRAVATKPLDGTVIDRLLVDFPGLKIERQDGYVVVRWHGREDAERGEAFAARLQAETGCLIADRRNGRLVELSTPVAAPLRRA